MFPLETSAFLTTAIDKMPLFNSISDYLIIIHIV